jgi:Mg2+ and Co2+ transporter CorA
MKRLMVVVVVLCLALVAAQRDQGRCEPVKGYSSYISLLPGGKDKQESNFSLIEQAKQEVKSLEIKNKKRDVKFEKPTDIYYLNAKYTMVSFEVYFRPIENSRFSTRPAIFGLLFEGTGSDGLTGYTSKYVKWIGKNDLADYKAASIKSFCGYFRREGVADCLPDTVAEKNASGIKKGTNREGRISGDQVTSGRIRAEFIDPSIARKKDVEKAVESSLGRMDQLRSDVKEQRESLTSLSQVLQTMEMRMKSFPDKEQEFIRKQEERLGTFDQKLKKIEENLTRQVEASKDLESKVDALTEIGRAHV